MSTRTVASALVGLTLASGTAYGAMVQGVFGDETQDEDAAQEQPRPTWKEFAEDVKRLHQREVEKQATERESEVGGYAGRPKYYKQVEHRDPESGKLISRIQWIREKPDKVHSMEVNVRDEQGRVQADYVVAYAPGRRNRPMQALVNIHNYNKDLHAFRQFDASGFRKYEYCEGEYEGRPVEIRLFEKDLDSTGPEIKQVMRSPVYKACFAGVPEKPGDYLDPI